MSALAKVHNDKPDLSRCPCCDQQLPDDEIVRIDWDSGLIICRGDFADLTSSETELFSILWESRSRTLSKTAILEKLYWQGSLDEEPEIKIIDVMICKIRAKLVGLPLKIETLWGQGYRIKLLQGEI